MTLFGIGPMELMVIVILALVIFGPKRLPEIGRSIGKAISDFRRASENVTSTVMRELDVAEDASKALEDLRRASDSVTSITTTLTRGLDLTEKAEVTGESLAAPAIRPVHSIPLDAVGKIQVVEEPQPSPAADDQPPVSSLTQEGTVFSEQITQSSSEG